MESIGRLSSSMEELGIKLNEKQEDQFKSYFNILTEWNSVMNLTTITEYNDVVDKHFVDSLSLIKAVDLKKNESIIDMGTGAGLPGIPLKIVFPQLRVVLMDSLNKRIKFLDHVIEKLGLTEIKAVHGRAEEAGRVKDYREKFDLCVSRAVANLSSLSEICLPFVRVDGYFVSYKAAEIEVEIEAAEKAIAVLGGKIEKVEKFYLPNTNIERSLIIIHKKYTTPRTYPRGGGKPFKNPL